MLPNLCLRRPAGGAARLSAEYPSTAGGTDMPAGGAHVN